MIMSDIVGVLSGLSYKLLGASDEGVPCESESDLSTSV